MRPTPRRLGAALAGLSIALAGGCVGTASPEEPFDASTLPASAILPGTYALPLDPVLSPPTDEYRARENAVDRAVAACMSARGFAYTAAESQYTQGPG